ncbi:MAG: hypothetical protein GY724_00385 [Actinomycetia bacterium]|nr:hypothetical protein [Actinomycetes bacterium]MCP4224443.1 hypothetical protein [Actinomycetes bacterium]MCP5033626.1 hypothetical protein [Actinomycetes bacterium]
MLLWFAVMAPVLVAEVFRSPMVDYRTVVVGALLPLVEVVTGLTFVLHTLVAPVLALGVVMGATVDNRLRRRRLLGLPIGLFLHLVLDGTWSSAEYFWWPAFGFGVEDPLPESGRHLLILIALDTIAIIVGLWAWRRYELADGVNRQHLIKTGHLARGVLG